MVGWIPFGTQIFPFTLMDLSFVAFYPVEACEDGSVRIGNYGFDAGSFKSFVDGRCELVCGSLSVPFKSNVNGAYINIIMDIVHRFK